MLDKTDLWMKLCIEAVIERNPQKFTELKDEICELLAAKEQRLLGVIQSSIGDC